MRVQVTWLSMTNWLIEAEQDSVLIDGYITRIPASNFYGGSVGYAHTRQAVRPDVAAITKVQEVLSLDRLTAIVVGHSHFDHSFDAPTWAHRTAGQLVGPHSTSLQALAQDVPLDALTSVYGGEQLNVGPLTRCHVVRWNHTGNCAHGDLRRPRELTSVPVPVGGEGFRPGVLEDYPNGGGSRGYIFVFGKGDDTISIFVVDSGSAHDLDKPIISEGIDYGPPLHNLEAAMKQADLERVDLWIGVGGVDIVEQVNPIVKARYYIPSHWDGMFHSPFDGVPFAFEEADPRLWRGIRPDDLTPELARHGTRLVIPQQYFEAWALDTENDCDGARLSHVDRTEQQRQLGIPV